MIIYAQNVFLGERVIESFNGKLGYEFLNREAFTILMKAKICCGYDISLEALGIVYQWTKANREVAARV